MTGFEYEGAPAHAPGGRLTFLAALFPPQQVVLSQDSPVPAGLSGLQQISGSQEVQHIQSQLRTHTHAQASCVCKKCAWMWSAIWPLWAAGKWSPSGSGAGWAASRAWDGPFHTPQSSGPAPAASRVRSTPAHQDAIVHLTHWTNTGTNLQAGWTDGPKCVFICSVGFCSSSYAIEQFNSAPLDIRTRPVHPFVSELRPHHQDFGIYKFSRASDIFYFILFFRPSLIFGRTKFP